MDYICIAECFPNQFEYVNNLHYNQTECILCDSSC